MIGVKHIKQQREYQTTMSTTTKNKPIHMKTATDNTTAAVVAAAAATTNTNTTTTTVIDDQAAVIEEKAQKLIQTISEFISQLRTIEAFQSPFSSSTTTTTTTTRALLKLKLEQLEKLKQSKEGEEEKEVFCVYQYFKEKHKGNGNGNNNSISHCNNNILDMIQQFSASSEATSKKVTRTTTQLQSNNDNNDNDKRHELEQDRYQLIHEICVPILNELTNLYIQLDSILPPPPPPTPKSNDPNKKRNNTKHHKKPIAPIGLLSLANYTDIASILEFTICTSIIPLLEPYMTFTIQDRVKYTLPKSLQGRLRKQSLFWGHDVFHVNKKLEQQQNQNQKEPCTTKILQVKKALVKIQNAQHELSIVCHAICQIIVLDRFRPMLLPRHVTDVYAILFQLERLYDLEIRFTQMLKDSGSDDNDNDDATSNSNSNSNSNSKSSNDNECRMNWIRHMFLGNGQIHSQQSITTTTTTTTTIMKRQHDTFFCNNNNIQPIDLYTQVKSFQSLLLAGKKTPVWLKVRVGTLLTQLAVSGTINSEESRCNNNSMNISSSKGLLSIIDVFVVDASSLPTEDITGASLRLANVLCTQRDGDTTSCDTSETMNNYYVTLLNHFLQLLDDLQLEEQEKNSHYNSQYTIMKQQQNEMSKRSVAVIITTWAVLQQLPMLYRDYFCRKVVRGLFPSNDNTTNAGRSSIKISISRILNLLMYAPPIVKGNQGSNAGNALNHFCNFLLSEDETLRHDLDGQNKAIPSAPGTTTPMGQILRISCSQGNKTIHCIDVEIATEILKIIVYTVCSNDCLEKSNEKTLETCIGTKILQSVAYNSFDLMQYQFLRHPESTENNVTLEITDTTDKKDTLISSMEDRTRFIIDNFMDEKHTQHGDIYKFLPCEMFKVLLLVYFESKPNNMEGYSNRLLPQNIGLNLDAFKIVSMMMLPLLCEKCSPASLFMDNLSGSNRVIEIVNLIIRSIAAYFGLKQNDNQFDSDTQLSIGSIVLSLLVAMLELGSEKRSDRDEKELLALLPSLEALSKLTLSSYQYSKVGESEDIETSKLNVLKAEISEMASHAMALIFSYSAKVSKVEDVDSSVDITDVAYIIKVLSNAEAQLQSDQPPLRARAVVQLRQLARGSLEEILMKGNHESNCLDKSFFIEEIDDDKDTIFKAAPPTLIVEDMLRVCCMSINDTESYVYLAAIQTIVSITDVLPAIAMPILVGAVATGGAKLFCHEKSEAEIIEIIPSQRIKLIEALIFSIRRRGDAISRYTDILLNGILYGNINSESTLASAKPHSSLSIQRETDTYFRPMKETIQDVVDEYTTSSGLDDDEGQLRFNTGGPVFDSEESDVVRAACISVLVELIAIMHPVSVVPYCQILVQLGLDALRLDHSRVVRRSAASLCRELYSCSLREIEECTERPKVTDASFSIALLQCDEQLLFTSIKRCVSADDVDILLSNGGNCAVGGKTRLYDPAIIARCEETIKIRETLEESGMLGLIHLYINSVANKNDTDTFVGSLLSKGQEKTKTDLFF
jgi:hypothetical protein